MVKKLTKISLFLTIVLKGKIIIFKSISVIFTLIRMGPQPYILRNLISPYIFYRNLKILLL